MLLQNGQCCKYQEAIFLFKMIKHDLIGNFRDTCGTIPWNFPHLALQFMLKIGRKRCDFSVIRQICLIFIDNDGILIKFKPPFYPISFFLSNTSKKPVTVSIKTTITATSNCLRLDQKIQNFYDTWQVRKSMPNTFTRHLKIASMFLIV